MGGVDVRRRGVRALPGAGLGVPRIDPHFLESERRALGDFAYRSEYEVEWLSASGAVFDADDIERCVNPELRPLGLLKARGWQ